MFTSKNLAQILLAIIFVFGVAILTFAVLIRDDISKCARDETRIAYDILVSSATLLTVVPIIGLTLIYNQYSVGNMILISYLLVSLASAGVFYAGITLNSSDVECASKYATPVWISGALSFLFSVFCIIISFNYDTKKKFKAIIKYEKSFREELDNNDIMETLDKKIKRLKSDESKILDKIKASLNVDPKYKDKKLDKEQQRSITKELYHTEQDKEMLLNQIKYNTTLGRDNLKQNVLNIYDEEIRAYTAKVEQLENIKKRVNGKLAEPKVEKAIKANEPIVVKTDIETTSQIKPVEAPIRAVVKNGFLQPQRNPLFGGVEIK